MIPDFKTFIKESIWSDMEDRGTGDLVKKEDEVDPMSLEDLYYYVNKNYKLAYPKTKWIIQPSKHDVPYSLDVPIFKFKDDHKNLRIRGENISLWLDYRKYIEKLNDENITDIWDIPDESWIDVPRKVVFETTDFEKFSELCPDFMKEFESKYQLNDISVVKELTLLSVTPKNGGDVTNTFFLEVLNFIIDNLDRTKVTQLIYK